MPTPQETSASGVSLPDGILTSGQPAKTTQNCNSSTSPSAPTREQNYEP